MTDALEGLGLNAAAAAAPPQQAGHKLQRFSRLTTLTAAELARTAPEQLEQLLAAQRANPQSRKRELESPAAAENSRPALPERPQGEAVRYEQVRRRRGLTNFEVTEGAPDPLKNIGAVYDIVHLDPAPAISPEDNALLCNYLPMVREYLHSTDGARTGPGTTNNDISEATEGMEEDGYVYDLYVEAGADSDEVSDSWMELHRKGAAPTVHIVDDDTWLVLEASDEEDSDAESEDSNAEGYFANDYPDEGEAWSSSEGSEGAWGDRAGHRRREWFDESDSDAEDEL